MEAGDRRGGGAHKSDKFSLERARNCLDGADGESEEWKEGRKSETTAGRGRGEGGRDRGTREELRK